MACDKQPVRADRESITIGPDNFVKVAGYPLGYIEGGCLIVRDTSQRRGLKRGGQWVAIPLTLLGQLSQAIENEDDYV